MRIFNLTLSLLISILLCSCAGIELDSYSNPKMASFKLTQELKPKIAVSITANHDTDKIACRGLMDNGGIDIYLPKEQTYTSYIQNAFIKTLTAANKYDTKSNLILNGKITKVDFDVSKGIWNIAGTFHDNKKKFKINTLYYFPTSSETQTACNNAAHSFSDAVTKFLLDTLEKIN